MSRKFLVIIFAALGLSVAACGDKDDDTGDTAAVAE